jgi:DNA-binding transcriptional ArsR family regulator
LAESDDYDEIFAALRHPVRRQILFLLEDRGEVSFTEIQSALGLNDTGLISYHLKELATLVEQSRRGKYSLSEVGRASLTLFRKVETEKDKTKRTVHRELEKLLGEAVFLFFIFGGTLLVPLSIDITLSVESVGQSSVLLVQVLMSTLIGLLGMLGGVLLFIFYDRHYFTRALRKNVVHATIFAIIPAFVLIASLSFQRLFVQISSMRDDSLMWSAGVLRSVLFLLVTPIMTYLVSRFLSNHSFHNL